MARRDRSDAELVRAFQDGDGEAFAELVQRYVRLAGAAAYQVLGDYERAADAVQEAWLRAVQSPPRQQGVGAWLRVVTQNAAISMLRSRDRRKRRELATAREEALPAIHAAYRGLDLKPQVGLIPLGPDPDTGLWEFAHLMSGAPPRRRPRPSPA